MSSLRDLEGRGRAAAVVLALPVWARREERWDVNERVVEEEISCFGGREGRGIPYKDGVLFAILDDGC